MFGAVVKLVNRLNKVAKAAKSVAFKNFKHAAARIRADAIASIVPSPDPSMPGTPPHTRAKTSRKTGKALKGVLQKAITFEASDTGAVIGPRQSVAGTSGKAHEFGGDYKGEQYPVRAFMRPALIKNLDRFAAEWAGSVGE